jgi:DNA polymerase III delta prime subunit
MSTIDLRRLVRERGLAKGAAVAVARKEDLIALLEGKQVAIAEPKLEQAQAAVASVDAGAGSDALADVIARAIAGKLTVGVDETRVRALIEETVQGLDIVTGETLAAAIAEELLKVIKPVVVDIRKPDGEVKRLEGMHHRRFPTLLKFAQARNKDGHVTPIYLCGPAGTGKTTAAHKLAEALGLEYYFNGAIDSEYKLSGFVDAQGVFRSRPFFEAYTKGGVYLFDELDSSLPGAVLAFNAALANGHADFPTGRHIRHANCIILAAGNTSLRGDGHHEGFQRFEMDAAFRDRFVFLDWPLDEELEAACVPPEYREWLATVRQVRANVVKHGIKKAAVTPRATFAGMALLGAGIGLPDVIDSTLRKGLPDDLWAKASEGAAANCREIAAAQAKEDAASGESVSASALSCPMCGKRLWVKHNKKTGHKFLGCQGFPACRYTRPIALQG